MIVKAMANMLSPGGRRGRLSILIFHRVLAQQDPIMNWDLDAFEFERAIRWLRDSFHILPLEQAVARLNDGSLPARAASITFDDGYADNFTVAMPILKSFDVTATFFIATSFLDGGRMWNDTVVEAVRHCRKKRLDLSDEGFGVYELTSTDAVRQAIMCILNGIKYREPSERLRAADYVAKVSDYGISGSNLMLTSDQVRMMRGSGMSIGAHTVTHPILGKMDPVEVQREVAESKHVLESLLQERVGLFAYPNGRPNVDYRAEDAEIIRSLGFDAAVTTAWGVADAESDLMQLPRFTPWDRTQFRFGARLLTNILQNPRLRSKQLAD